MNSPPATKPKSALGRIGGIMRRNSSILPDTQATQPVKPTPASERDSDSVSTKSKSKVGGIMRRGSTAIPQAVRPTKPSPERDSDSVSTKSKSGSILRRGSSAIPQVLRPTKPTSERVQDSDTASTKSKPGRIGMGSVVRRATGVFANSTSQVPQTGSPPTSERDADSVSTKSKSKSGIMRRASNAIPQVLRPTKPASDVSPKQTMLRKVTIPSAVEVPPLPSQPRASTEAPLAIAIAESPVDEPEALEQEIVPSAQEARSASPLSMDMNAAVTAAPGGIEEEQEANPMPYILPVTDSSAANLGAFTDEPEALPLPDESYAAAPVPEESTTDLPPTTIDSFTDNLRGFTDEPEAFPQADIVVEPHTSALVQEETATDFSPPVVDSFLGEGATTDESEALSQPNVVVEQNAEATTDSLLPLPPPPPAVNFFNSHDAAPASAETAIESSAPIVDSFADEPKADLDAHLPQPVVSATPDSSASAPNPEAESEPEPEAPAQELSTSSLDEPMAEIIKDFEFIEHEEANDSKAIDEPAVAPVTEEAVLEVQVTPEPVSAASPAPKPEPTLASSPAPQETVEREHREAVLDLQGNSSTSVAELMQAPPSTESIAAPTSSPAPIPAPTQEPATVTVQPTYSTTVKPNPPRQNTTSGSTEGVYGLVGPMVQYLILSWRSLLALAMRKMR